MIVYLLFVVLVVCVFLLLLPLARMSDEMLQDGNNPFGGQLSDNSWLGRYYKAWLDTYRNTPLGGTSWFPWLILLLIAYLWYKYGRN